MPVQPVRVEGLREVNRALAKTGDDLDKGLKAETKQIADIVAKDAQRRTPVRTGRARRSIRPGATAKGAYVAGGKKSVPYYGWLDFGSRQPISGRPRSVGPWRGSGHGPKQGRFIYPALKENRREVEKRTKTVIKKAKRSAGL